MSEPKLLRAAKPPPITPGEYRVMEALWKLSSATVAEIATALKEKRAYTTIMTVLRVLEGKGYVRHEPDGRTYVYAPAVGREEARRRVVDHITRAFFGGSPRTLMLHLADGAAWDERLAGRLRELLGDTEV